MAVVKKVDFKLKVDINVSIKYQILTYCFFNDVLLTKTDLEFLYELSLNSKIEIAKFCEILTDRKIFKSSQSARNAISKIEKKGLLIKAGNNKKTMTNVALIAVAKDEDTYIHEWIHHHLYLGFSPIYIGVNRTSDKTFDIINPV